MIFAVLDCVQQRRIAVNNVWNCSCWRPMHFGA